MAEWRIMENPPCMGPHPFYVEERVYGRWYIARWVKKTPEFDRVEDARCYIESVEAGRRMKEERLRAVPREVAYGHVAMDGRFHQLRRD